MIIIEQYCIFLINVLCYHITSDDTYKYWKMRYHLFDKFYEGILLDEGILKKIFIPSHIFVIT
jgi:hypothetical protein